MDEYEKILFEGMEFNNPVDLSDIKINWVKFTEEVKGISSKYC